MICFSLFHNLIILRNVFLFWDIVLLVSGYRLLFYRCAVVHCCSLLYYCILLFTRVLLYTVVHSCTFAHCYTVFHSCTIVYCCTLLYCCTFLYCSILLFTIVLLCTVILLYCYTLLFTVLLYIVHVLVPQAYFSNTTARISHSSTKNTKNQQLNTDLFRGEQRTVPRIKIRQ